MSAADTVVLIAAIVACIAALVGVVAAFVLVGQVRRFERAVETLRGETLAMVHDAHQAIDHASTGIARVGAILEDTESVTATVESAGRLAERAFTNPVVKLLAYRAGTAGTIRRLRQPAAKGASRGRSPRPAP